jgi:GTP-binding protein
MERRDFIRISPIPAAMNPFSAAQFVLSAARAADFPGADAPEIAFAGRSNVGKSSAINALTGRKGLARTSKTPGRTQTINFYAVGESARLVDLPGYGYARVPQALRAQWQRLVGDYLGQRSAVRGIVVIMDARHPLTPLDLQLIAWLGDMRKHVLLTKADKLARSAQRAVLARTLAALPGASAQLFSSVTRQGVEDCRGLLAEWLPAGLGIKNPR